jgi:adenosylcobinamide-GDP ribazoletransferase
MKSLYLGLKFSLSYFTILPISFQKKDDLSAPSVLAYMLFFLPFIGLLLGLATIMIVTFSNHWLSYLFAAISYMMLYGFIHTEAVCDVTDALYAKHGGKDAYTIIKEPTIGAMGLFYGLSFFILKVGAIIALFEAGKLWEFVAVLLISRLALLLLITLLPFKSTFVTTLKDALTFPYILSAFSIFSLIGVMMIGVDFLFLLLFGLILSYIIARFIGAQLGFINGDVLGVVLESVEILLFIMIGTL